MKTYKHNDAEFIMVCHGRYEDRELSVLIEVGTGDVRLVDADTFGNQFSEIRELELAEMQEAVSKRLAELMVSKMFAGLHPERNYLEYRTMNCCSLVLESDNRYTIIDIDNTLIARFRGRRIASGTLDHCKSMIDLHIRTQ